MFVDRMLWNNSQRLQIKLENVVQFSYQIAASTHEKRAAQASKRALNAATRALRP
jgi:hypothetical protein